MRPHCCFTLALCLSVTPAHADPCAADDPACPAAPPKDLPALLVTIDKQRVDLEQHQLEVKLNRPAGKVELTVYDESGLVLAQVTQSFAGRSAGSALVVKWTQKSNTPIAKIEVYAYDQWGFYKALALVPWSFVVPHEEVEFETNSAAIRPEQEPKLEASLTLIRAALEEHGDLGKVALFIAGHTDTRGTPENNAKLSLQRARAIAAWFRQHGLTLPIAYEGFGEGVPKVKTADEVDEAQNRRVDYVLSVDPVRLASGAVPNWRQL